MQATGLPVSMGCQRVVPFTKCHVEFSSIALNGDLLWTLHIISLLSMPIFNHSGLFTAGFQSEVVEYYGSMNM